MTFYVSLVCEHLLEAVTCQRIQSELLVSLWLLSRIRRLIDSKCKCSTIWLPCRGTDWTNRSWSSRMSLGQSKHWEKRPRSSWMRACANLPLLDIHSLVLATARSSTDSWLLVGLASCRNRTSDNCSTWRINSSSKLLRKVSALRIFTSVWLI